ncbi:MAG: type 4a pilus biogenesis protein PilO [Parcubacteria group bacterium]|nr:type 4a pilus biogenesis protein PilO [Parcubacteria group bacterium]
MISTIAFALLLIALVVLIIIPAFSEIKVINQQVFEERTRLEALYTRGQVLKTVQENYRAVKNDLAFLNGVMLPEREELGYITALETLADDAGIELGIEAGSQKRTPETRFSELPFLLTASGDWERILRFLSALESLPYYTNINEMTVAAHTDELDKKTRSVRVTMAATTYWRIPAAASLP